MKFDVAIIGGGPAGYTAAERVAAAGLSTVIFEKNTLGGVCLNEGCVPTKTLLYSAKVYDTTKHASKYGIQVEKPSFDLGRIIARKNKIVKKLTAGIRMKLANHNVVSVQGEAVIQGKDEESLVVITCNSETYYATKLILCTGSETVIPPISGLSESCYWTNKEALMSKELPASLVVIGGGVIGMEFASFYNSLGCEVHVVEMADEILGGMDKQLSAMLRANYSKRGVVFHLGCKVTAVTSTEVTIVKDELEEQLVTEQILLSVGRRPVLKGFGLENLNLTPHLNGIKVNEYMQTSDPAIYACGDLTAISLLAHTAVSEAEEAVKHITGVASKGMSYQAIPAVVYTNPEIAAVGKTEEQLISDQIPYTIKELPFSFSGRFVAENEQENGICKWIISTDETLLGVHLLGNPSSEIITIAGMAVEMNMKVADFQNFVFPHPTVGEILKESLY